MSFQIRVYCKGFPTIIVYPTPSGEKMKFKDIVKDLLSGGEEDNSSCMSEEEEEAFDTLVESLEWETSEVRAYYKNRRRNRR